jgi:ATP-dependent helicase/DNAse subunit B
MRLLLTLLCLAMLSAQQQIPPPDVPPKEENDRKLPNGKSQNEAILKADYEKSLKDSARLVELSQSLQQELEANDSHILSISSLKKAEEIEKIAKRIHGRLRR